MKLEIHHSFGYLPKWLYFILVVCIIIALLCVGIGVAGMLGFGPAA